MFTLEQKLNLVMRYIATTNDTQQAQLKKRIIEALSSETGETPEPVREACDYTDIIFDILKELGMPPHLLGYDYTFEAIKLVLLDRAYLREITTSLYPSIASKFNTTPSSAERAIRHSVEVIFDRGGIENVSKMFGNTMSIEKGKLTNSEFIAFITNEANRRARKLNVTV